ncbi:hypothetical protein Tco_0924471 [Tanacetum coccineum]|uniref:Uncharacterized protein n=1 Tax=Tanacetum coccineum TaxID=301880 RepID=A0ABQ5D6P0_9ASTR
MHVNTSRVIVQQVQGRQGQRYSGTGYKSNATSSEGNNASGQARVVKCYNCKVKDIWLGNALSLSNQGMQLYKDKAIQSFQTILLSETDDLDTNDSDEMISQKQKRHSWPTFPNIVLMLSQST